MVVFQPEPQVRMVRDTGRFNALAHAGPRGAIIPLERRRAEPGADPGGSIRSISPFPHRVVRSNMILRPLALTTLECGIQFHYPTSVEV